MKKLQDPVLSVPGTTLLRTSTLATREQDSSSMAESEICRSAGTEDGCLDENKKRRLAARSVGRRKDKRAASADYVTATFLIVVSHLDQ